MTQDEKQKIREAFEDFKEDLSNFKDTYIDEKLVTELFEEHFAEILE